MRNTLKSLLVAALFIATTMAPAAFAAGINASSLFDPSTGSILVTELQKVAKDGQVTSIEWGGYKIAESTTEITVDKEGIFIDAPAGRLTKGQSVPSGQPFTVWPPDISLWETSEDEVVNASTIKTVADIAKISVGGGYTVLNDGGIQFVLTVNLLVDKPSLTSQKYIWEKGEATEGVTIPRDAMVTRYEIQATDDQPDTTEEINSISKLNNTDGILNKVEGLPFYVWKAGSTPITFGTKLVVYRENGVRFPSGELTVVGAIYDIVDTEGYRDIKIYALDDVLNYSLERVGFESQTVDQGYGRKVYLEATIKVAKGLKAVTEKGEFGVGDTLEGDQWVTFYASGAAFEARPTNPNPTNPGTDSGSGGGGGGCSTTGGLALIIASVPLVVRKLYELSYRVF